MQSLVQNAEIMTINYAFFSMTNNRFLKRNIQVKNVYINSVPYITTNIGKQSKTVVYICSAKYFIKKKKNQGLLSCINNAKMH